MVLSEYCTAQSLNDFQRKAVLASVRSFLLSPLHQDDRKSLPRPLNRLTKSVPEHEPFPVRLIQGPPGTGKTKTLLALISAMCGVGARVLVCAPTNVAVAEVAVRLAKLVEDADERSQFGAYCDQPADDPRCAVARLQARLHSRWARSKLRTLRLGDVVVVGSEERLDVTRDLGKVFLGAFSSDPVTSRVERLTDALSPATGWKPQCQALLTLLEKGPARLRSDWQQWQEDKMGYEDGDGEDGEGDEEDEDGEEDEAVEEGEEEDERRRKWKKGGSGRAPSEDLSLPAFLREQLESIVGNLVQSGECLCQDMPSQWMPEDVHSRIQLIMSYAKQLRALFQPKSLTSSQVTAWLVGTSSGGVSFSGSTTSTQQSAAGVYGPTFGAVRMKLVQLLAARPGYALAEEAQSRDALVNNLVAHAQVVLATASSAGRAMVRLSGEFQLLLLDEAAQLVEAESLISLEAVGLRFAVLVGDPKQLPATVFSKVCLPLQIPAAFASKACCDRGPRKSDKPRPRFFTVVTQSRAVVCCGSSVLRLVG